MNTNDWTQKGKIYLWRYDDASKNQKGWHLTADSEGASSLIALIDLFLKMDGATRRTVRLTAPTDNELRVPGFRNKAIAAEKLLLATTGEDGPSWSLASEDDTVRLSLDKSHLMELRSGVEDVRSGKGDYCIGSDRQKLWFWWRKDA